MKDQPVPSPIKQFYQVAIDKCQTALRKAVDVRESMAGVPDFFEKVKSIYLERLASNIDDWNGDHEFIFEFTDELEVKYEEFSTYKERIQFRNLVQANYSGKRQKLDNGSEAQEESTPSNLTLAARRNKKAQDKKASESGAAGVADKDSYAELERARAKL